MSTTHTTSGSAVTFSWYLPPPDLAASGMREPLRPKPVDRSGAVSLPIPRYEFLEVKR